MVKVVILPKGARVAGRVAPGARPKRRSTRGRKVAGRKSLPGLIKRVLNNQLETKYVAEQVNLAGYAIPGAITPDVDYHYMLPPVQQQTVAATSNTREGDIIEPTRGNIKGHIWYDNLDTKVGNVVFVKLFFVTAKNLRYLPNASTDLPDGLLEAGLADPVKWTAAAQDLQAFFPICKENYTLLKTMTFKLVKNGGVPIGNNEGDSTNIGRDRYTFSYSWKPPKLKYAVDSHTYPQNHAPIMFAVAYSPGYNYATDASLVNQVKMNWQTSITYKDA